MSENPDWAKELIATYKANASSQFILHGNVNDRMLLPLDGELGNLEDFLYKSLLKSFDIVLSYDLGKGLVVIKESKPDIFSLDKVIPCGGPYPKAPKQAIEAVSQYVRARYNLNVINPKTEKYRVAFIMKAAHLVCPVVQNNLNYDLSALALLVREWTIETAMLNSQFITFLICDNLNDLHPVLATNTRAKRIEIPLPSKQELKDSLDICLRKYPNAIEMDDALKADKPAQDSHAISEAIEDRNNQIDKIASGMVGVMTGTLEAMVKTKHYNNEYITDKDIVTIKKQMIERDANGLLQFMQSERTLDDLSNNDGVRNWIRKDIALWKKGKLNAVPMGYLFAAPVGCGKNFIVECIAGEAGIPVVTIGNFRDKFVGNTEANVERIFRFIDALGKVIVFIDEADQTMGKRDSGNSDGGLSGRVYSMFATKMSNPLNRGKILWIMASSRPDLIELDLKRPGRIDVKIPLFPTCTDDDAYALLKVVCKKVGVLLPDSLPLDLRSKMPKLLTPGGATTLASKVYRSIEIEALSPTDALTEALKGYQNPIPLETLEFQIGLAVKESSDKDFVPEYFQARYATNG